METQPCTCALLECVGNCFFTANCKHLHPNEHIKKADEGLKPKKKPLKLGGGDFKPVEESKGGSFGNTTQASTKEKGLNTNASEFDPYKFTYSKQFEDEYLPEDLEDPEGFNEDPFDGEPMGDSDVEDEYYFHPPSQNCDCCKGLINACDGQICQIFGYCHCYATEIEEKKFSQKRHK